MYRETTTVRTRHSGKENEYTLQVDVLPVYLENESKPQESQFVFGYRVTISNLGQTQAQLLSRRWIITDGTKQVRTVEGPGVIGQQPVIEPKNGFEYSSFCPLSTPTGNMRGTYQMMGVLGEPFEIKIPLFFFNASAKPAGVAPTLH